MSGKLATMANLNRKANTGTPVACGSRGSGLGLAGWLADCAAVFPNANSFPSALPVIPKALNRYFRQLPLPGLSSSTAVDSGHRSHAPLSLQQEGPRTLPSSRLRLSSRPHPPSCVGPGSTASQPPAGGASSRRHARRLRTAPSRLSLESWRKGSKAGRRPRPHLARTLPPSPRRARAPAASALRRTSFPRSLG